MDTTLDRVRRVIAEEMSMSIDSVVPEADVIADLGPDSLEQVQIVMGLEAEFSISLGDDSPEFGTVQDVANRVEEVSSVHNVNPEMD